MKTFAYSMIVSGLVSASAVSSANACDPPTVHRHVSYPAVTHTYRTISHPVVVRQVAQPAVAAVQEVVYVAKPAVPTKTTKVSLVSIEQSSIVRSESVTGIRCDATYRMPAKFLGSERGEVVLSVGGLPLNCEIVEWTQDAVTFKTPSLDIAASATARVEIFRADGRSVKTKNVELLPAGLEEVQYVAPSAEIAYLSQNEQ